MTYDMWHTSHSSNLDHNLDVGKDTSDLCTNVDFDFERRKWTDGKSLENDDFIKKWENKFDSLWYDLSGVYPPQPYQPEYVLIKMDFKYKA